MSTLIFIGKFNQLQGVLDKRPVNLHADLSISDFRSQLVQFVTRQNVALIIHAPLTIEKQYSLLKYSEECAGDVIIYSQFYIPNLLVPIKGRFLTYIGDMIYNPDSNLSKWAEKGYDFGPKSYKYLLENQQPSRSKLLFFRSLKLLQGAKK